MIRSGILFSGLLVLIGCAYNDISIRIDCATSGLEVVLDTKLDATGCKAIDGNLSVLASGGEPPYDFSLNGGTYQTNPFFDRLGPGTYTITVKDKNNCVNTVDILLVAANSTLAASVTATQPDNQCLADNGSVTVTATGGTSPYQYKFTNGVFDVNNTFSGLKFGQYSVIVKDAEDCQTTVSITIGRGDTGVSYQSTIKPILDASCTFSGCHGSGTGSRDWTNFSNLQSRASAVKLRTGNRSMPIGSGPSLTQQQIDQIACWVDDGAKNN